MTSSSRVTVEQEDDDVRQREPGGRAREGMDATWAIIDPQDLRAGGTATIRDGRDLDALIAALSQPEASAALIHHRGRPLTEVDGEEMPDHELAAGIHRGFGYLTHFDSDHEYAVSVGDPDSPPFPAYYVEYAAGSGVDLPAFRVALIEFLTTAQRPTSISWHEPA